MLLCVLRESYIYAFGGFDGDCFAGTCTSGRYSIDVVENIYTCTWEPLRHNMADHNAPTALLGSNSDTLIVDGFGRCPFITGGF